MASLKKSEKLGRNLSFMATFALGTGTMIGAGIFVLPGIAINNGGPAAVLSFFLEGYWPYVLHLVCLSLQLVCPKQVVVIIL